MKDPAKLSHRELAAFVSDHLRTQGIETVLSGGACVTIYTSTMFLANSKKSPKTFSAGIVTLNGFRNCRNSLKPKCDYTCNSYESYDLDFVNIAEAPPARIKSALLQIGFVPEGRIYLNKKVKYSIDILNPPLSIGDEKISATATIVVKKMRLELLTTTDSVRDRLAAFYFWNDLQALEQALMVARDHDIDLDLVKKWSKKEGELEKFAIFLKKLKSKF